MFSNFVFGHSPNGSMVRAPPPPASNNASIGVRPSFRVDDTEPDIPDDREVDFITSGLTTAASKRRRSSLGDVLSAPGSSEQAGILGRRSTSLAGVSASVRASITAAITQGANGAATHANGRTTTSPSSMNNSRASTNNTPFGIGAAPSAVGIASAAVGSTQSHQQHHSSSRVHGGGAGNNNNFSFVFATNNGPPSHGASAGVSTTVSGTTTPAARAIRVAAAVGGAARRKSLHHAIAIPSHATRTSPHLRTHSGANTNAATAGHQSDHSAASANGSTAVGAGPSSTHDGASTNSGSEATAGVQFATRTLAETLAALGGSMGLGFIPQMMPRRGPGLRNFGMLSGTSAATMDDHAVLAVPARVAAGMTGLRLDDYGMGDDDDAGPKYAWMADIPAYVPHNQGASVGGEEGAARSHGAAHRPHGGRRRGASRVHRRVRSHGSSNDNLSTSALAVTSGGTSDTTNVRSVGSPHGMEQGAVDASPMASIDGSPTQLRTNAAASPLSASPVSVAAAVSPTPGESEPFNGRSGGGGDLDRDAAGAETTPPSPAPPPPPSALDEISCPSPPYRDLSILAARSAVADHLSDLRTAEEIARDEAADRALHDARNEAMLLGGYSGSYSRRPRSKRPRSRSRAMLRAGLTSLSSTMQTGNGLDFAELLRNANGDGAPRGGNSSPRTPGVTHDGGRVGGGAFDRLGPAGNSDGGPVGNSEAAIARAAAVAAAVEQRFGRANSVGGGASGGDLPPAWSDNRPWGTMTSGTLGGTFTAGGVGGGDSTHGGGGGTSPDPQRCHREPADLADIMGVMSIVIEGGFAATSSTPKGEGDPGANQQHSYQLQQYHQQLMMGEMAVGGGQHGGAYLGYGPTSTSGGSGSGGSGHFDGVGDESETDEYGSDSTDSTSSASDGGEQDDGCQTPAIEDQADRHTFMFDDAVIRSSEFLQRFSDQVELRVHHLDRKYRRKAGLHNSTHRHNRQIVAAGVGDDGGDGGACVDGTSVDAAGPAAGRSDTATASAASVNNVGVKRVTSPLGVPLSHADRVGGSPIDTAATAITSPDRLLSVGPSRRLGGDGMTDFNHLNTSGDNHDVDMLLASFTQQLLESTAVMRHSDDATSSTPTTGGGGSLLAAVHHSDRLGHHSGPSTASGADNAFPSPQPPNTQPDGYASPGLVERTHSRAGSVQASLDTTSVVPLPTLAVTAPSPAPGRNVLVVAEYEHNNSGSASATLRQHLPPLMNSSGRCVSLSSTIPDSSANPTFVGGALHTHHNTPTMSPAPLHPTAHQQHRSVGGGSVFDATPNRDRSSVTSYSAAMGGLRGSGGDSSNGNGGSAGGKKRSATALGHVNWASGVDAAQVDDDGQIGRGGGAQGGFAFPPIRVSRYRRRLLATVASQAHFAARVEMLHEIARDAAVRRMARLPAIKHD